MSSASVDSVAGALTKTRVLYVEDDARLLLAWRKLLEKQPDMHLTATLGRADELTRAVHEQKPDVVMMDLTMHGLEPLKMIRELSAAHPNARVLVYSGRGESELVDAVFEAGAWGFVYKDEETSAVLAAIRRVAKGEVVMPRSTSA